MDFQLIVRALYIGVCGGDSGGNDLGLEAPFVHDFQTPDVTGQTAVDNEVVPDPYRTNFRLYDTVIEVTGEYDAMHPLTSQCQGQQVAFRVHVERDVIQDFRWLTGDVATRGGRADERFHDHQEVHREFVFFWGHLVLTSSELCGQQ